MKRSLRLDWAVRYPLVWLDLPSIWQRRARRDVTDLPVEINAKDYPDYYLQNFHPNDGYLSDPLGELYDLQVEILFNGTADDAPPVDSPLLDQLGGRRADPIRVLDIATGTGRTLRQSGCFAQSAAGGPRPLRVVPAASQSLAFGDSGELRAGSGQRGRAAVCQRGDAGGDLRVPDP